MVTPSIRTGVALRIAQRGWEGTYPAVTLDEVGAGVGVSWIEIDGHRIASERIAGVDIDMAWDNFADPQVRLHLIGSVELVYVDGDGEPLPGGELPHAVIATEDLVGEEMDYQTQLPRP